MSRYTERASVSQQERAMLAGLLVLGQTSERETRRIVQVIARILGQKNEDDGHASDAIYSFYTVDELLAKMELPVADAPNLPHRERHQQLHEMFDELLADYLAHNREARPNTTTAAELARWSNEQTIEPMEHET